MKSFILLLILSILVLMNPAISNADGGGDSQAQALKNEMKRRFLDKNPAPVTMPKPDQGGAGLPPPPSSPPIPPMPGPSSPESPGAPMKVPASFP